MTTFKVILTVEADGSHVDVNRMEVELEEAGDKQAAMDAINVLNLDRLLYSEEENVIEDSGIDDKTAMAIAMGALGVGQ